MFAQRVEPIHTAQKMKFSIKHFFSKCDQIRRKLRIWSHLLKKFLMENFIFCAAPMETFPSIEYMNKTIKAKTFLHTVTVIQRCSVKKRFLEISQNSQENTCTRVSFLMKLQAWACNVIKKRTLAQVFFCEICEFSKSTFCYRTTPVAASVYIIL